MLAHNGRKALLERGKRAAHGNLTIQLGIPGSMVQLEANGVTDKGAQDLLAGSIDLDALEKALTN